MVCPKSSWKIGALGAVVLMMSGMVWAHDPTAHPAWKTLGPAGAFPAIRAVAVEGDTVFALSDKGLSLVAKDGTVRNLASADMVGKAHSLMVTPGAVWLGGPDGVRRMDRTSGRMEGWTSDQPAAATDRVLFDGEGGIYTYDATSHELSAYEASGRFRWRVMKIYDQPDTLATPLAVARRRSGDIYVADAENNRIVIFSGDGQYRGRVPDNFCRPHGLGSLPGDRLAVLCDYTERIDTPLITILNAEDIAEADWVSDQRVVTPRKPAFYKYCLSYYQKIGEHPKRPPESISPLGCCALLGDALLVGQSATGSLRAIELSEFGQRAKYPARRRRVHRQRITSSRARYTLQLNGTLDWRNTKRSTTHSGYCLTPLFMADDSYTITNTGKTPVINPHFSINGKGDYFSAEHIRRNIVKPGMSDLEKAFAVYNFVRRNLAGTNWPASSTGLQSQYYVFDWWGIKKQGIHLTSKWNNFGAPGACGCYSAYVAKFAHDLGLEARNGGVVGHCPSFVVVDGKEVYLDSIMAYSPRNPIVGIFCPRIDDRGFADYEDVVHDQYLILRVCEFPKGMDVGGCFGHRERHNMKPYDQKPVWLTYEDTSKMALTLRPGESITRRTAWLGRSAVEPKMLMDAIVNGDITYRPNFADGTYRFGAVEEDGVAVVGGALRPTAPESSVAFSMACPHPLLTGTVELGYERESSADELEMDLNIAGRGWERIWRASKVGSATEMIYLWPLDRIRDIEEQEWQIPTFEYAVRFRMRPAGPGHSMAIRSLSISSLFQTFYQCLPRLELGANRVDYEDETPGAHEVAIVHRWKESSFGAEPPPPGEPIFPKDGATVTGYDFTFKWKPTADPSGAKIVDYEWEASKRPDFLWPVAPNFSMYTRGKTEERVPNYSLLTDGVTYYWHVRSRNDRGVWGPWGKTWTFRCEGPRVPVDVNIRQDGRNWILSWKPNPEGTRPVRYEIFGDRQPGFYPVVDKWRTYEDNRYKPFDKPSNIILVTDKTEAVVVSEEGEKLDRTFFRVAAIDARGSRSGPSKYVEARHPFIFTSPVTEARGGKPYRYQARSLWSKGEFALGRPGVTRPHMDKIRFQLKQTPQWLKVNPESGVLAGTPAEPGTAEVVLEVTDGQGGSDSQSFRIRVSR